MSNLDGTDKPEAVPFDAHDKVVRDSSGYKFRAYPKAVAHVKHPFGHLEPVLALNAANEADLRKAEKEKEKEK